MILRICFLSALLFSLISLNIQAYSQQKIKDFYLSNLKEDGTRDWEINGDEALISDTHIDIENMEANYYLKEDTILITSDNARMNKENMDVALKDNVYIENEEGATLVTDSLNWQRETNHIETQDKVKTTKDSMQITAVGLSADTQLKTADFEEEVEVTFADVKSGDVTTAICTGPLEIEYNKGKAVFNNDVVITNIHGKMYSDKATLFFDTEAKVLIKVVSEGNVKIIREDNVAFSQKATYLGNEQRIVLEGKPRIMYFPKEGEEVKFPF